MKKQTFTILIVATFSIAACFSTKKETQKPMQNYIKPLAVQLKSFLDEQWKYTGKWTIDDAKPIFSASKNSWTLSFKDNKVFADGKKVADFQIQDGLLRFENMEKGFAKEGFQQFNRKAFFYISTNKSQSELMLNPADENGIFICDEGCELVFENVTF